MKIANKPTGSPLTTSDAAASAQATKSNRASSSGVDAILTKSTGKSPGAANSTRVDVSERGQQVKKAKEIASKDLHAVDEAKVARFQKMIDEGKYKVDAEAIADRLVDEQMNMPS